MRKTVEFASELSLDVLSLYAFSDENWRRSKLEIAGIFQLLEQYVKAELDVLKRHRIRLRIIGDLRKLPQSAQESLRRAEAALAEGDGLLLNIALSYGARNEMVEACRSIAQQVADGALNPEQISAGTINSHLWTTGLVDPDLLIRTSGEQRLSNFLLLQMAYTELYFPEVYWPDFEKRHFVEALVAYQNRKRRFGRESEACSSGPA